MSDNSSASDSDSGSDFSIEDEPKTEPEQVAMEPKEEDDDNEDTDMSETEETPEKHESEVTYKAPDRRISSIKNKEVRSKLYKKQQLEKKKRRKAERKRRRAEGGERSTGNTIESMREPDQTAVANLEEEEVAEMRQELATDEFSEYYAKCYAPKVLITYADNPLARTRLFGRELSRIIPNSIAKIRNRMSMKKMCKAATEANFTDIIVINEDHREPNGMVVVHLPHGPTAHFKISNVRLTKDIHRNYKEITEHRPEVITTNFTTRLGLTVGRMLGALFHQEPEFKGRRAVTFHNQRDFIFFRHHRYEFTQDGKKAKLRELGPRFTLKLRSLQQGTFDSKTGDYEWIITNKRHAMEDRRRFYL